MEEVVADKVQEGSDEKYYTAGKDEKMCQPGIKLFRLEVIERETPVSQTISQTKKLSVYNTIDNSNNYEILNSLAQMVKSVSLGAQPPYSDAPIDSIDKDNSGNCC